MTPVEWIFFDLDGTLWDHDRASQDAIMAVCERYGLSPISFVPLFKESNLHMWRELEQGRADFEELRVRRFEMALERLACGCSPIDTLEMSRHYNAVYTQRSYPMPGLQETLAAGRQIAHVAIITNAPRVTQEGKIRHLALPDGLVQFMLCAGDTPWLKPDPRFFAEARQRAGNPPPERILVVGDSWEGDIETPARLGWQTAWISHGRQVPITKEDTLVFAGLPELARQLRQRGGVEKQHFA